MRRGVADLDGLGQNPELAVARQPFFVDGQTLSRQRRFTDYGSTDTVLRAEISGSFKLADTTHHVLFGGDYEEFELDRLQTRYRPPAFNASSTLATMNAVNIFAPVYGNAPLANQNVFNDTEKDESYGIYFSDQIDLSRAWKLRLGGRWDSFKQEIDNRLATVQPPKQDVTKFSPQAGISNGSIGFHVKAALAAGATREEIAETIGLAIYMGAGPSMIYGAETLRALNELAPAPKA